jgi:hypothetical protein
MTTSGPSIFLQTTSLNVNRIRKGCGRRLICEAKPDITRGFSQNSNALGADLVRDRDHLKGAYRGATHSECNL